jgi:hypothetical protein
MDLSGSCTGHQSRLGRASELKQWNLAVCTQVTKRYIQLFARRKAAPVGRPFEIYARMSGFLKTPEGELSKLADLQKCERVKKILSGQTERMHRPCRHSSEKSDSERWPYSATGSSRGESVLGYYGGRIHGEPSHFDCNGTSGFASGSHESWFIGGERSARLARHASTAGYFSAEGPNVTPAVCNGRSLRRCH